VLRFQEKAKKILDIWTKSTTFPPAVLTRLENVLKGDDAPGTYHVPNFMFAKYSPFCAIPNCAFALRFLESEKICECLICFVLVPAPAVIEPVMPSALPQAALSPAANAEMQMPTDAASQAASVKATLLALLSQASNVPMSVDGP
jgi:protein NRD1